LWRLLQEHQLIRADTESSKIAPIERTGDREIPIVILPTNRVDLLDDALRDRFYEI
jgi:AAA+ superfamily predicted ATPase